MLFHRLKIKKKMETAWPIPNRIARECQNPPRETSIIQERDSPMSVILASQT
jgi:hypothetical protein